VIANAKELYYKVTNRLGDSSNSLLLNGSSNAGCAPSQPGFIESQGNNCLSLRTSSSEGKGTFTGLGFLIGIYGILIFFLLCLFGKPSESNSDAWFLLFSILAIIIPAAWEISRPPYLPIIFNRRTQEIYYDFKGQLYHTIWDGIEAVAYEYKMVNQYSGSITHGNLEIILQKFGEPENRIALNLSGVPAGKRLSTLIGIWEYLRCFMTIGPWFDETGKKTESKSLFIEKNLKSNQLSFLDLVLESRTLLAQEKKEGNGISGTAVLYWINSHFLLPYALGMECIQRIDRKKSKRYWPEVVQERLDPNGPTTRLIDIEESYMKQKQKELDELHERMRRVLPK